MILLTLFILGLLLSLAGVGMIVLGNPIGGAVIVFGLMAMVASFPEP